MDPLYAPNNSFKQREDPRQPDWLFELLKLFRVWVDAVQKFLSLKPRSITSLDPLDLSFFSLLFLPFFIHSNFIADASMHL